MAEVTSPAQDAESGAFLDAPPPFFSVAYHLRFLPRVIVYRLAQQRGRPSGFGGHVQMEIPLVLFACVLLLVFGLPPALQHGSLGGWASASIGAGGLVALMGWSIIGEWRWRREEHRGYGYAEFMPSVFFFCMLAGVSAGLIGGVITNAPSMGYLWAGVGLAAGYLLGPFAARWVHGLGFIKIWFIYLAILGLILLPLEDLMVLLIYANKGD